MHHKKEQLNNNKITHTYKPTNENTIRNRKGNDTRNTLKQYNK